jgi:hypothetical protein
MSIQGRSLKNKLSFIWQIRFMFMGSLLLFFQNIFFAEESFVKALKVDLLDQDSPQGKSLLVLKQGMKVDIKEKKGFWYRVEVQNDQRSVGWLPKLMLQQTNLVANGDQKDSIFSTSQMAVQGRKRASMTSAAGAARGLKETDTEYFRSMKNADYQAVKKMMSYFHDPKKISFR